MVCGRKHTCTSLINSVYFGCEARHRFETILRPKEGEALVVVPTRLGKRWKEPPREVLCGFCDNLLVWKAWSQAQRLYKTKWGK
ncbi:hypothetical protein HAX54_031478, partial [Datura stramonium]|nr:hypothetical protein [Datura stramonium]